MVAVVQSASNSGSNGSTVTVTLGSPTTGGNCLVAGTQSSDISSNPHVSGITLGGVADHFAALVSPIGTTGTTAGVLDIWADPNCANNQTSVVVTWNAVGSHEQQAFVDEVSGLVASGVLDQSATSFTTTTNATFTSGTTPATTQASELWYGLVGGFQTTITGPGAPWTNSSQLGNLITRSLMRGYQVVSATGTAVYSGSYSPASFSEAGVVTLKGTVSGPTPAPFIQPARAPRGLPGAVRGRALTGLSSRGAPYQTTPAPFIQPARAPRGLPGAVRGRALTGLSSRGAPYQTTPSPFIQPARAPRGLPGAVRGRALTGLSSRGAPFTASTARTLLISLASKAGTDDYNNVFPQGIFASAGVIQGPVFIGPDYIINAAGAFFYSSAPAAGNLIGSSMVAVAGVDAFGNNYLAGMTSYAATFATSVQSGFVAFYVGSLAGGWSAISEIAGDASGNVQINAGGQLQLIAGTNVTIQGSSNTQQSPNTGFFNTQGLASGSYGSTHQHTLPNFTTATHVHPL